MIDKNSIIIIGAGGHSKVVLSTLLAMGKPVAGFVDDNTALIKSEILGYPVLGKISFLADRPNQAAIIGVGDNAIRKKLAITHAHLQWQTAIHPSATIHESVKIAAGSVIFAGVIIQPDSSVGEHTIINTAATIDHDCHIGNFAHIAPGSNLAGGVNIGEGTFIGINSCVIPTVTIGDWSILGAGSVVVKNIQARVVAKGVPAEAYKENSV